jgi:hypothetical protein
VRIVEGFLLCQPKIIYTSEIHLFGGIWKLLFGQSSLNCKIDYTIRPLSF